MNDQELIRFIEGQSLILNTFGMRSEYHINEDVFPEFRKKYWEVYEVTNFVDCKPLYESGEGERGGGTPC